MAFPEVSKEFIGKNVLLVREKTKQSLIANCLGYQLIQDPLEAQVFSGWMLVTGS